VLRRLPFLDGGPGGLFSGEGAYLSPLGETDRSIPRCGRGGILGASSCAALFWPRAGRGGIAGGADMLYVFGLGRCGED
jgi:hypothetical protein